MGLFSKKNCVICGKELGLMGKRKLEDGYLCKDCATKLSPFFSERRSSTTEQIREQLAYREANWDRVAAFQPTLTLGSDMKVMIDEDARCFIVTRASKWKDANPDVIDFSQVTGCSVDVDETRTEIKHKDDEGKDVSYDPPRYDTDYDIWVTVRVNSPWFDEIKFKTNSSRLQARTSPEYQSAEKCANEICEALQGARKVVRDEVVAANTPKMAVTCPHCSASTIPDASGRCEYCGGAVGA